MQDGARAHQKAHAAEYELLVNGIKDEIDTAGQIRLVEQMLAQHVDALVIAPADSSALVPVLATAVSRGVVVINIDNRLDCAALNGKKINVPFVGPDNRMGARLAGDFLAKQLKAGAESRHHRRHPHHGECAAAHVGFQGCDGRRRHHRGQRANPVNGNCRMANTVATAMLSEHPDLAACCAATTTMALGAAAAVRARGKSGQVKVVGYDNHRRGLKTHAGRWPHDGHGGPVRFAAGGVRHRGWR